MPVDSEGELPGEGVGLDATGKPGLTGVGVDDTPPGGACLAVAGVEKGAGGGPEEEVVSGVVPSGTPGHSPQ